MGRHGSQGFPVTRASGGGGARVATHPMAPTRPTLHRASKGAEAGPLDPTAWRLGVAAAGARPARSARGRRCRRPDRPRMLPGPHQCCSVQHAAASRWRPARPRMRHRRPQLQERCALAPCSSSLRHEDGRRQAH